MKKLSSEKIVKWLYKHCYDKTKNEIDLSGLDFSDYNCNVQTCGMIVNGTVYQGGHKATKIYQDGQEADEIYQYRQTANYIDQSDLNANEIIIDDTSLFDAEPTQIYLKLTPKKPLLTEEQKEKLLNFKIEDEMREQLLVKDKLTKLLYDNFYDKTWKTINLMHLDFTPYHCNVAISGMAVDGALYQDKQTANEIYQGFCSAEEIDQSGQTAKRVVQKYLKANEVVMDNLDKYSVTKNDLYMTLTQLAKNKTKDEAEK